MGFESFIELSVCVCCSLLTPPPLTFPEKSDGGKYRRGSEWIGDNSEINGLMTHLEATLERLNNIWTSCHCWLSLPPWWQWRGLNPFFGSRDMFGHVGKWMHEQGHSNLCYQCLHSALHTAWGHAVKLCASLTTWYVHQVKSRSDMWRFLLVSSIVVSTCLVTPLAPYVMSRVAE